MKIFLLFLAISFQVSAIATAQQVSINVKDAKILSVLKAIQSQTKFGYIVAAGTNLETAKPVTLSLKSSPIETTLQTLFADQPFTYKLNTKAKIIIIRRKPEEVKPSKVSSQSEQSSAKPEVTLTGLIQDKDGRPLAGATVMIKGTKLGGVSGPDGRFFIPGAPETGSIIVRMIGKETREIPFRNGKVTDISLEDVEADLTEVQVVAYGQVEKKYGTSNQGAITGEQISRQPVSNPLLALQGRVPGLFIQQTSGQSIGRVGVLIQGLNTLSAGVEPFYVVDGVPFSPNFTENTIAGGFNINPNVIGAKTGSGGSTFNFINPADIESVTILKDADATAIYGSRAANGAILITTKRGKPGKTKVDLNLQSGWGKVTRRPEFLTTEQYLDLKRDAFKNSNQPIPTPETAPGTNNYPLTIWDPNKNHDWWDELVGGTANFTTMQASVSGGSEQTTFLAGGGYSKQTTVFPNDLADKKYNVNLAINTKSDNNKFNFMIKGSFLQDLNRLNGTDLTNSIKLLAPNAPDLYNPDGTLNWGPFPKDPNRFSFENPLKDIYNEYYGTSNNFLSSGLASYEIIPGLVLKSSFGYNMLFGNEKVLRKFEAFRPDAIGATSSSSFSDRSVKSYIIEPQITYAKQTEFGAFDFLIGTTFQQTKTNFEEIFAQGFNNNSQLADIKAATSIVPQGAYEWLYKYNAVFSRLNYRYADKYIVNLTARRDGSSRFGSNNKFSNFYSVGGAWLFAEEDFTKSILPRLSTGKIRMNYGTTGNDQISDYLYESSLDARPTDIPYQGINSLVPSRLSNPSLQWESTKKFNVGLDLGFFDNRISLSADYFRNRSSNQLVDYILPYIAGFTTVKKNFEATIQNTGIELLLNARAISRTDFNWNISVNATVPRNKLVSFPGLESSSYANFYVIGQPVNIIKAYEFAGVNPKTGLYEFKTAKGEVTNFPNYDNDRTQLINVNPKWYGGFSNTISYKSFTLDFLLQYVDQVANNIRFETNLPGYGSASLPSYFVNRWRKEGDITDVEKVTAGASSTARSAQQSNARYGDASFLRLKNASLSYNIPATILKKTGIGSVRAYVQGQNLLTFTNYEGADPETHSFGYLPPLRMFTLGLQVSL